MKTRVKMLTTAAGPDFQLQSGKEYEVNADFAEALIAGGYATSAEPAPVAAPVAVATDAEPVETEKATAKTRKEKR